MDSMDLMDPMDCMDRKPPLIPRSPRTPRWCCALLGRQIEAQAKAFVEEGGFTERLHRVRTEARRQPRRP